MTNYQEIQTLLKNVTGYAINNEVGGCAILGTPISAARDAPISATEIRRLLAPVEDHSMTVNITIPGNGRFQSPRNGMIFLVDDKILRLTTENIRVLDGATEMWDPKTGLLTIALLTGKVIPTSELVPYYWW